MSPVTGLFETRPILQRLLHSNICSFINLRFKYFFYMLGEYKALFLFPPTPSFVAIYCEAVELFCTVFLMLLQSYSFNVSVVMWELNSET